MPLTAGIVGLPNVGKSTLFNAITRASVLAANYPFATIEPNVGIVNVPDHRLDILNKMYNPKKLTPATVEFTDIAGLVKGASKGEGLGNQFLSNIRNCDAIIQVVRCFEDPNIIHVESTVDPIRDVKIINFELILSDLEIIEKRLPKIEKKAQSNVDDAKFEFQLLSKVKNHLLEEKMIRTMELDDTESKFIKNFGFLTLKPMLYVANVKEEFINNLDADNNYKIFKEYATSLDSKVIPISAQIEAELGMLDDEDRLLFLNDLGLNEPGLDALIKATYDLLGYATYFTTGPDEVRAWTFKKGMTAPECAGIIHTDFQKGFIKAETVSYDDLVQNSGREGAREKGLIRQEGKEYKVVDGDIMLFKFNN